MEIRVVEKEEEALGKIRQKIFKETPKLPNESLGDCFNRKAEKYDKILKELKNKGRIL